MPNALQRIIRLFDGKKSNNRVAPMRGYSSEAAVDKQFTNRMHIPEVELDNSSRQTEERSGAKHTVDGQTKMSYSIGEHCTLIEDSKVTVQNQTVKNAVQTSAINSLGLPASGIVTTHSRTTVANHDTLQDAALDDGGSDEAQPSYFYDGCLDYDLGSLDDADVALQDALLLDVQKDSSVVIEQHTGIITDFQAYPVPGFPHLESDDVGSDEKTAPILLADGFEEFIPEVAAGANYFEDGLVRAGESKAAKALAAASQSIADHDLDPSLIHPIAEIHQQSPHPSSQRALNQLLRRAESADELFLVTQIRDYWVSDIAPYADSPTISRITAQRLIWRYSSLPDFGTVANQLSDLIDLFNLSTSALERYWSFLGFLEDWIVRGELAIQDLDLGYIGPDVLATENGLLACRISWNSMGANLPAFDEEAEDLGLSSLDAASKLRSIGEAVDLMESDWNYCK